MHARRRRRVDDCERVRRVSIKKGEEWSKPRSDDVAVQVSGNDADLGAAIHALPNGALVQFTPTTDSDLARAVGLNNNARLTNEVALDALRVNRDITACNIVILGTPPDRLRRWSPRSDLLVTIDGVSTHANAMAVVVAIGQFLRGHDVVPRGHPGDGRAEVHIYEIPRSHVRAMRRRLPRGAHVPGPGIFQRSGRHITIQAQSQVSLEVDGVTLPPTDHLDLEVLPDRYRLLI
jgi:hypothetical protein